MATDAMRRHGLRPWVAALSLLSAIPSCMDAIYYAVTDRADVPRLVTVAVTIVVPLWMAVRPAGGTWAAVATYCVAELVPYRFPLTLMVPAYVAMGVLGYGRTAYGMAAGILASCAAFADVLREGDMSRLAGATTMTLSFAVAVLAGIALRTEHGRRERQRENEEYQRNAWSAQRLHDYTTNDLCGIIMLVDRARSRGYDETLLDHIENLAETALRQTRLVIEALDTGGLPDDETVDFARDVARVAAERQRVLAALGLRGKIVVPRNFPDAPAGDAGRLTVDLLQELSANIAKYAARGGGYVITVACDGANMSVNASNTASDPSGAGPGMGTGMLRCRDRVERMGGTWRTSSSGSRWSLEAVFPAGGTSADVEKIAQPLNVRRA